MWCWLSFSLISYQFASWSFLPAIPNYLQFVHCITLMYIQTYPYFEKSSLHLLLLLAPRPSSKLHPDIYCRQISYVLPKHCEYTILILTYHTDLTWPYIPSSYFLIFLLSFVSNPLKKSSILTVTPSSPPFISGTHLNWSFHLDSCSKITLYKIINVFDMAINNGQSLVLTSVTPHSCSIWYN